MYLQYFFFILAEGLYPIPDKPPALKLILKVGGNCGTPEHGGGESPSQTTMLSQHYQQQLGFNYSVTGGEQEFDRYLGHKKLKKKKKKKDKRHKHHHKDKKRKREESSQESVGDGDESMVEAPKKVALNHQPLPSRPVIPPNIEPRATNPAAASGLSPHREPRTCVLRKIAERTPLQRLLEHLLRLSHCSLL
jgi:bromodomain-containing protein 7/9